MKFCVNAFIDIRIPEVSWLIFRLLNSYVYTMSHEVEKWVVCRWSSGNNRTRFIARYHPSIRLEKQKKPVKRVVFIRWSGQVSIRFHSGYRLGMFMAAPNWRMKSLLIFLRLSLLWKNKSHEMNSFSHCLRFPLPREWSLVVTALP
jgi:hypothetical protein